MCCHGNHTAFHSISRVLINTSESCSVSRIISSKRSLYQQLPVSLPTLEPCRGIELAIKHVHLNDTHPVFSSMQSPLCNGPVECSGKKPLDPLPVLHQLGEIGTCQWRSACPLRQSHGTPPTVGCPPTFEPQDACTSQSHHSRGLEHTPSPPPPWCRTQGGYSILPSSYHQALGHHFDHEGQSVICRLTLAWRRQLGEESPTDLGNGHC